ncbi:MAG: penicillin-binding transpeptidase domain-containing protein [bacterium]
MHNYVSKLRGRLVSLFYASALVFFLLALWLTNLQVFQAARLEAKGREQYFGNLEIDALRGDICDREGHVLASSLSLPSIAVDPRNVRNRERTAFYLSLALGVRETGVREMLNTRHSFAWVARKVPEETARKIEALSLDGVFIKREPTGKRFYPKDRLASHVLGFSGIDDQGLAGVEKEYDRYLKGIPGKLEAEMDNLEIPVPFRKSHLKPAVPGSKVVLTIDETIQYVAERELSKTVKKFGAEGGCVIVMDSANGEILAMASLPDYQPEKYAATSQDNFKNRPIFDYYEPGSTFKVITALAGLDSGRISTSDKFYCGDSIQMGGYTIHNANDGCISPSGRENVEGVLTFSYNVGAVGIAMKTGKQILFDYALRLGFGRQTGVDLPGEREGILLPLKEWSPSSLATISFGQGVAVTPIQMVQAMAVVANGGMMVQPHVMKAIISSDGNESKKFAPTKKIERVIAPRTAEILRHILCQVVEKGTGKRAKIPGYQVAGKTGTAQVCDNGRYVDAYVGSFLGFVPADNPRMVMLVKIDRPKGAIWGGYVAAPVFRKVAGEALWHLKVPPEFPEEMDPFHAKDIITDAE